MTLESWTRLVDELAHWRDGRLTARLWLRDDDAVSATPALDALLCRCRSNRVPVLVATIPLALERSLVEMVGNEPLVSIAVHGIAHRNHAPPDRKAEELAPERGRAEILVALRPAITRVRDHFGGEAVRWYVPPWNRIAPKVASWLPDVGFSRISTFGPRRLGLGPALLEVNTHVDIIDWKGGRVGRAESWVAAELTRQLVVARTEGGRPVGILTHHLVHDAAAWRALDQIIAHTVPHPAVRWVSADEAAAASAP